MAAFLHDQNMAVGLEKEISKSGIDLDIIDFKH